MSRDLAAAVNGNLETAFVRLAENAPDGTTRQFGPIAVRSAGLPVPFYNRVFAFESPPREEFAAAVAWMAERDLPYRVTVTEAVVDTLERLAGPLDLVKAGTQPGMAMLTPDEIPSTGPRDSITEVTTRDALDEFVSVAASAFGRPAKIVREVYRAALTGDGMRLFLARVDGRPAACGLSVRSGDAAGVYAIGVIDEFRRRGIGEAMSWEVLCAGREAGCQVGVLQSSEMAHPLYGKVGFETVVTYHQFEPAA